MLGYAKKLLARACRGAWPLLDRNVHVHEHVGDGDHHARDLVDEHFPSWREARAELNALPLSAEEWSE